MSDPKIKDPLTEAAMGVPLRQAGQINRTIAAPLVRVWENVHDWEHLPHLHDSSFSKCELEVEAPWGWRARTRPANDDGQGPDGVVELVTDHKAGHYVSRVIEGPGEAMEIWTKLIPQGDATDIEVRFLVPAPEDMDLGFIGEAMVGLYTQLWDEDEQMMVERHQALQRARRSEEEIALGKRDSISLPMTVESTQGPVHVDEVAGELTAWLGVCPHLLGPLDPTCRKGRTVTCPWHGYQFDCKTGEGIGGDLKIKTRCEIIDRNGDLFVQVSS